MNKGVVLDQQLILDTVIDALPRDLQDIPSNEELKSATIDEKLLKSLGFTDEMISLIKNIESNKYKPAELNKLINSKIPSLVEFNEDDRLTKLYDDYHKMTCDSWYGNHRDCHSKLDEIKNLEFTIILERYKRLLNNYYLTLVNYLSTCSDFEESCETGHGNPRCGLLNKSDITGKNITGIKLKELWKDFLISDKDGKYKWNLMSSDTGTTPTKALLNVEEVMGIGVIEDIELFKAAAKIELICPHVMDTTKRLPGEDDEYFVVSIT